MSSLRDHSLGLPVYINITKTQDDHHKRTRKVIYMLELVTASHHRIPRPRRCYGVLPRVPNIISSPLSPRPSHGQAPPSHNVQTSILDNCKSAKCGEGHSTSTCGNPAAPCSHATISDISVSFRPPFKFVAMSINISHNRLNKQGISI